MLFIFNSILSVFRFPGSSTFSAMGVLFFVMASSVNAQSQNAKVDSLRKAYSNSAQDTSRVKILNELTKEAGIKIRNYDTALHYAGEARILSQKIRYSKGECQALLYLGTIYQELEKFTLAIRCHDTARVIATSIGDTVMMANANTYMGMSYTRIGNYPEAITFFLTALRYAEKLNDQGLTARIYNNLGLVYNLQGNYDQALKSHKASLKIKTDLGDKQGMSKSYNNIGLIYCETENFSEALRYYGMSMQIKQELHDRIGIAMSYNNIGDVQFAQGNYSAALENFNRALFIRDSLDDQRGVAASCGNIGRAYLALNKPQEAQSWLLKSIGLATQLGLKEIMRNSYLTLSETDSALGDYKSGFLHYKMYILYRDSLSNEESTKKSLQAQMEYELDKQEAVYSEQQVKERAIADERSRKQRLITYFIAGGLILVLLFAGFIWRSLSMTRKQKKIIELQEEQTRVQKAVIEEKHREITDSINYAERIQRSFLATNAILSENLKEYFVFFKPKDVVSGDFYWAAKLHNGNFMIACADSTGHGVPGAIMSILNISSLELAVREKLSEPADILNFTRRAIISRLENDGSAEGGKDGMDCALVVFNKDRSAMMYAAANNPIWIVRDGQLIELKPDKMPVGKHLNDHVPFAQNEIEIHSGDVIYALTDGLPDQFGGPKGKKFKYAQLKEILIANSHLPMKEQELLLDKAFTDWKGDLEQIDDVTIFGVRV